MIDTCIDSRLFTKQSKCFLFHFVSENKSVANHFQVNHLVSVTVQNCHVIQSFLCDSRSQKCFEPSQTGKTSFCCATGDWQGKIKLKQVDDL